MTRPDPDALLRRLERTALLFCLGAAAVALGLRRGRPDVALGILAGGVLIGTSYWAIRSSVDALLVLLAPPPEAADVVSEGHGRPSRSRRPGVAVLLRITGRYALLILLAYAMIARLRVHPIGLLIGVSSAVVAACIEAIRSLAGSTGTTRREPAGTSRSSP
jgi:hypothetical protein